VNDEQREKVGSGKGFIAALDQSGGSTPGALKHYGVPEAVYAGDEQKMFDLVHEMRARVVESKAFDGDRVLAAILFEGTMRRRIGGVPTIRYLWEEKRVVPFVKVDQGLADPADGVRLMKPMTKLDTLLEDVVREGGFGTKMRSFVLGANPAGIGRVLDQQFEYGLRILRAGLVPILEPEVDVTAGDKAEAEELLKAGIVERLSSVPEGRQVMLKVSIPTVDGFYSDLIADPRVLRVVALSGGYSREEADERLARNPGLIASFSRALLEGLRHDQSEADFDAALDASISAIYAASVT
jgi:fructose-bisphosphate aldolase class I